MHERKSREHDETMVSMEDWADSLGGIGAEVNM